MRLISTQPDLTKCAIDGSGTSKADAGKDAKFTVYFVDGYSNPATPGQEVVLGLALVPEAMRKSGGAPDLMRVESHAYTPEAHTVPS